MKIRQLAVAAATLEPLRSQLMALFGVDEDYRDPGVGEFGLENSVMALGNDFFEIVAPTQPDTAVSRALLRQQTDCIGYMVLFQVGDFEAFEQHAEALKLRKVWSVERDDVVACHIHPKDIGGAIVSFDEMRPPHEWVWAGQDWQTRKARYINGLRGLEFEAADAETLAQQWAQVTQRSLSVHEGSYQIEFDGQTEAQFNPSDHDAITAFKLVCAEPDAALQRAASLGLTVQNRCVMVGQLQLQFVA